MIEGQILSDVEWVPPVTVQSDVIYNGPAAIRAVKIGVRGVQVSVPIPSLPELLRVLASFLPVDHG